jgi:ribosomal-protein-alanine N-acetyltransferase
MTSATDAVELAPMRWWHIEEILLIEKELFGAEQWTEAMFWSELAAPDRWYRVALKRTPSAKAPSASAPSAKASSEGTGLAKSPSEGSAGELVLGYAGLCVYPDDAWVQNIAVRKSSQGRGIGPALLDELLAEAVRRGAPQISLEVAADNPVAQSLYEKRGFSTIGIRRGYYQPSGTDALVMAKEV